MSFIPKSSTDIFILFPQDISVHTLFSVLSVHLFNLFTDESVTPSSVYQHEIP